MSTRKINTSNAKGAEAVLLAARPDSEMAACTVCSCSAAEHTCSTFVGVVGDADVIDAQVCIARQMLASAPRWVCTIFARPLTGDERQTALDPLHSASFSAKNPAEIVLLTPEMLRIQTARQAIEGRDQCGPQSHRRSGSIHQSKAARKSEIHSRLSRHFSQTHRNAPPCE